MGDTMMMGIYCTLGVFLRLAVWKPALRLTGSLAKENRGVASMDAFVPDKACASQLPCACCPLLIPMNTALVSSIK